MSASRAVVLVFSGLLLGCGGPDRGAAERVLAAFPEAMAAAFAMSC
jgi:hypothetical protein